jgi:hypothetical protein
VWAAWHSALKRDGALKILTPGASDETGAARIEREVKATSELTHPNTARRASGTALNGEPPDPGGGQERGHRDDRGTAAVNFFVQL